MKLGFKKISPLIAVFCLLSASASLHAFTPPEGYQGRFLVPRTLAIQPGIINPAIQHRNRNRDLKTTSRSRKAYAFVFMSSKSMCATASMHTKIMLRVITTASPWRGSRTPAV